MTERDAQVGTKGNLRIGDEILIRARVEYLHRDEKTLVFVELLDCVERKNKYIWLRITKPEAK